MWLRRDKQAFEGDQHTLRVARERQAKGNAAPTRLVRARRSVTCDRLGDMPVWRVRPKRRRPVAHVVYLHGGGYIHPLTSDYWRLVDALAGSPASVAVPEYPLAPDAHADDVLPRLVEVVRAARADDPALPLVLMGDSAGGALALVLSRLLAEGDGSGADAAVLLSPWLDATLAEDEVADLEATDPMLAESGLRAAGRWWAGERTPDDPLVSPVGIDLAGLPPLVVHIGSRDILRPAVDTLAERARQVSARLHVHEVTAMFHVWMTRAIPEARRTRRQLRRLVAAGRPFVPQAD